MFHFQPHHFFFLQTGVQYQVDQTVRAWFFGRALQQALHFVIKQQLRQRWQGPL